MNLRRANRDDLSCLVDWIADEKSCRDWAGPRVRYPLDVPSLADDLGLDTHSSFALTNDHGDLLAFGQVMRIPDGRLHLARIIVRPDRRDEGLGRALCGQLIARSRADCGQRDITLKVSRDNDPALALYRGLGFLPVATTMSAGSATGSLVMILPTGPSLQLRATTERELRWVVDLERSPGVVDFIVPYPLDRHRRELNNPDVSYKCVLGPSEELVGFVILVLDPDGRSVEFRRVVIGPKGLGYGKQVVRLIDLVTGYEIGRSRIWLDVFEHNGRGRHIYEAAGYRQYSTVEHEGATLCLYEKELLWVPRDRDDQGV